MNGSGHIELHWAIDAIQLGARARRALGDIGPLVNSIREHGLLQPITVSPDGVLLCGARRLAALRQLGARTIPVWVRAGISTRLERLLAEQDENTLHESLRPTEAAALYREVKQLLAEEAARRQEATWFGGEPGHDEGPSGAAKLAAPSARTSRAKAARLVTGSNSYTTLERVNEIDALAHDPAEAEPVRRAAIEALDRMDRDGKVFGHYRDVTALRGRPDAAALTELGQHALDRIASPTAISPTPTPTPTPTQAKPASIRTFLLICDELDGWTDRFDPAVIGPGLSEERWTAFEAVIATGIRFLEAARAARTSGPALVQVLATTDSA